MKAILINKDILDDKDLSFEEICHLIALQEDYEFELKEDILNNLEIKKYIKLKTKTIVTRQKCINLINSLKKEIDYIGDKVQLVTKKTDREVNAEIENRVGEYRKIFKGYKTGSMGSLSNCKTNLSTFLKNNPEYTLDDIMNAAKVYVNSVDNFRYLQRADYFIYKQQADKSWVSTLEAYIDESIDNTDDNWTTKLN